MLLSYKASLSQRGLPHTPQDDTSFGSLTLTGFSLLTLSVPDSHFRNQNTLLIFNIYDSNKPGKPYEAGRYNQMQQVI
ncbi:hypothetical protein ABFV55_27470, partial [Pseudomonas syringae]|uniref:hypothetical protein n=1 Tax=Pseudomonas syringae TaxID=317 RepID=UPI0034D97C51